MAAGSGRRLRCGGVQAWAPKKHSGRCAPAACCGWRYGSGATAAGHGARRAPPHLGDAVLLQVRGEPGVQRGVALLQRVLQGARGPAHVMPAGDEGHALGTSRAGIGASQPAAAILLRLLDRAGGCDSQPCMCVALVLAQTRHGCRSTQYYTSQRRSGKRMPANCRYCLPRSHAARQAAAPVGEDAHEAVTVAVTQRRVIRAAHPCWTPSPPAGHGSGCRTLCGRGIRTADVRAGGGGVGGCGQQAVRSH